MKPDPTVADTPPKVKPEPITADELESAIAEAHGYREWRVIETLCERAHRAAVRIRELERWEPPQGYRWNNFEARWERKDGALWVYPPDDTEREWQAYTARAQDGTGRTAAEAIRAAKEASS